MTSSLRAAALLCLAAACSGPSEVCRDDAAITKIVMECGLTFSAAGDIPCGATSGAPTLGPDGQRQREELLPIERELCRRRDPDLDADCVRTTSCDELSQCSPPFPGAEGCEAQCKGTGASCASRCEQPSYDACLDCHGDCARNLEGCLASCDVTGSPAR